MFAVQAGDIILGVGLTGRASGKGAAGFIRAELARLQADGVVALATMLKPVLSPLLQQLADNLGGVPLLCYPPARLEQETPRLKRPSAVVYRTVGCHGVAEAAALAAAGADAQLLLAKTPFNGMTFALARRNSL